MPDMTMLADVYLDALRNSGVPMQTVKVDRRYNVVIFDPGYGVPFVITLHDDDPEYLRMYTVVPARQLGVGEQALRWICNKLTHDKKAAKASVDDDGDVWLAIEAFVAGENQLPDRDLIRAVTPRNIGVLTLTLKLLLEQLSLVQQVDALDDMP